MRKQFIAATLGLSLLTSGTVASADITKFKEPPFEAYKVLPGDSFFFIAERYGIDYEELMRLNPTVDPLNIQIGSIIRLKPEATTNPNDTTNSREEIINNIIKTGTDLIGKATYADIGEVDPASLKFRCASFMHYIFAQNGVDLGRPDEDYMVKLGSPVEKSQLQRGDLVFFDGDKNGLLDHVGIYVGDNKILHMADSKLNVVISDLSGQWYVDSYVTARRVIK